MKILRYCFIYLYIFVVLSVPSFLFVKMFNTTEISINKKILFVESTGVGVNSLNKIEMKKSVDHNASVDFFNIKKNNVFNNFTTSLIPNLNFASASYTNVLETQVGKLTSYGPDCSGCSGRVGWGQNVTNGNIYYNDSTYGTVRILAGDKKYPYGTIVKINDGTPYYGIVLDRGGSVGIGKATMFDLLFSSNAEASSYGTRNNIKFEILRYGF